jgi:hypothetical protein
MEKMGGKGLDERSTELRRGDIVAAPVNNVNYSPFRSDLVVIGDMLNQPLKFPGFLATMKGEVGAGFYAANRGPCHSRSALSLLRKWLLLHWGVSFSWPLFQRSE